MKLSNVEIAEAYIALFNDPSAGAEQLKSFLAENVVYEEMPNLLAPQGSKRGLADMLMGIEQGKELLSEQHYQIDRAVSEDEVVALEVSWRGKLARGFGEVAAGTQLRARIAMFLTFAEGRIVHQRNYDAYEPIA